MRILESPIDYQAALEGAAYAPRLTVGCLTIADHDHLDFLQRQTTNDLRLLNKGRSVLTVLVSPIARILDVLRLVKQEEEILALTLPGHSENTFQYLQRRIFFNDRVRLSDASQEYCQIDLEGPEMPNALKSLEISQEPKLDDVIAAEYKDIPVIAIGQRGIAGLGVRLITPAAAANNIEHALLASGTVKLSQESYNILRVEAGLPAAPAELSEEYTPLEVGMDYTVSDSKGCYPGQEVIARQITYDKVTRKLVGMKLEAPAQPGMRLLAEGTPVGEVTSAALSPRFGPIALGVVRRPHHEAGMRLQVNVEERIRVEIVGLPFQDS